MLVSKYRLNRNNARIINSYVNRHEMHRDIQTLFGESREDAPNVYRVVERGSDLFLYIYSDKSLASMPAKSGMEYMGEGKVPVRFDGDTVSIEMLVTPIKTVTFEDDGKKRKVSINREDERIEWCRRKALDYGFVIHQIVESSKETLGMRKGSVGWRVDAYVYRLSATITDADKFKRCLLHGFGRNGAYGAGMMIIA